MVELGLNLMWMSEMRQELVSQNLIHCLKSWSSEGAGVQLPASTYSPWLSFPGKLPGITQTCNFKTASAFKSWAPSWPQGTRLNPHIRSSDSLEHHSLLRPQVHQLAGASGPRRQSFKTLFHFSSCPKETEAEEVSSKQPKLKERSSKFFSPRSLGKYQALNFPVTP